MLDWRGQELLNLMQKKVDRFLIATGELGQSIASYNSRVDTGASKNAKTYDNKKRNSVKLIAPLFYDFYLEKRYGIMVKTLDEIKPLLGGLQDKFFK